MATRSALKVVGKFQLSRYRTPIRKVQAPLILVSEHVPGIRGINLFIVERVSRGLSGEIANVFIRNWISFWVFKLDFFCTSSLFLCCVGHCWCSNVIHVELLMGKMYQRNCIFFFKELRIELVALYSPFEAIHWNEYTDGQTDRLLVISLFMV